MCLTCIDKQLESSEQQAGRGMSDACKGTNETDRDAEKAIYTLLAAAKGDGHADK